MTQVLTQAEAVALYLPQVEAKGADYAKFAKVEARKAVPGEVIVTTTSAGVETQNTAKDGDLVLCNVETNAKEEYILAEAKVNKRYRLLGAGSREGWNLYQACGEFRGFVYDGEDTSFVAKWDEEMVLKTGDYIGTPLPEKDQVYRIGREEFESTYRLKS
jgi:hypothetical protein